MKKRIIKKMIFFNLLIIICSSKLYATEILLPVQYEHQLRSNWCWASLSLSVMNYYGIYPGITEPAPHDNGTGQCVIVTETISDWLGYYRNCCILDNDGCNKAWGVTGPLHDLWGFGLNVDQRDLDENETFAQISNYKPVMLKWTWFDEEGAEHAHLIGIVGMDNVTDEVVILNPSSGYHIRDFDYVVDTGNAEWTETYRITSAPSTPSSCSNAGNFGDRTDYNVDLRYATTEDEGYSWRTNCNITASEFVLDNEQENSFEAGEKITLKPGFIVYQNTDFSAKIVN